MSAPSDPEIVITRLIDAPRGRVWKAFSDPEYIKRWWGPDGFTNTTHEMAFREGGVWRYTMHGPDGTDYPNRVRYEELVEPERMVYIHDNDTDNDPGHFRTFITLAEEQGKTRVTLRMTCKTEAMRKHIAEHGAIEGGEQTLGRLAQYTEQQ